MNHFKFKINSSPLDELLPVLQQLDQLLAQAMATAQLTYGTELGADAYRGLYVSQNDVEQALARELGIALFPVNEDELEEFLRSSVDGSSRLSWLKHQFNLSDFDIFLVLIALAPELDLRYERIYAYLQDNVTRKRPTIDLSLNLLCASPAEKIARRAHFAADAPLIQLGLLELAPDPNHVQPSFLAHSIKLDEQIVRLLLGQEGLDPRLMPFCQLIQPSALLEQPSLNPSIQQGLLALATQARAVDQPLQFYFYGPRGAGKQQAAEVLAHQLKSSLLTVDLAQADLKLDFAQILSLLLREADIQNAILYLNGVDSLYSSERTIQYQQLLVALAEHGGIMILTGERQWLSTSTVTINVRTNVIPIYFAMPDFTQRRTCWETSLRAAGIQLDNLDLDVLADRFRLAPGQITDAVSMAQRQVDWHTAQSIDQEQKPLQPNLDHLFAAARAQSDCDLSNLVRKIEPKYGWRDIVLPPDQQAQLREICDQVQYRHIVYRQWGFSRKLSLGKGLTVLFSGPPGTGKTMAAEVIANELRLDLYKIDLSQVVSKYIGETEKNLDRIFRAAETANAILFFDEADALFGRRSEVKDAHDRYANIEIGYLLQKMEEYEGIAILATNLRQNMDEAFVRRIQAIVEFPFPNEEYRQQIWSVVFPAEAPLSETVDFAVLGRYISLSGGNIKNIALLAAFYAAEANELIQMPHFMQAARREYQKLGRIWNEAEWNEYMNNGEKLIDGN
jgi:AAA+ superfamily predicted ATPase